MKEKDYIKFAKMLNINRKIIIEGYDNKEKILPGRVFKFIENDIIAIFKEDNPNFNITKFREIAEGIKE